MPTLLDLNQDRREITGYTKTHDVSDETVFVVWGVVGVCCNISQMSKKGIDFSQDEEDLNLYTSEAKDSRSDAPGVLRGMGLNLGDMDKAEYLSELDGPSIQESDVLVRNISLFLF